MKVNALVKRGSLYMQHEKVDDSLKDFDKAAVLDPTNSDVFHHRGQVSVCFALIRCEIFGNVFRLKADV